MSYQETFRFYVLKNPITMDVFYVGKTTKLLTDRLRMHISTLRFEPDSDRTKYIQSLLSSDASPIIEQIDEVLNIQICSKAIASYVEYFWINHYRLKDSPLTNHHGVKTDPFTLHYVRLINLKKIRPEESAMILSTLTKYKYHNQRSGYWIKSNE